MGFRGQNFDFARDIPNNCIQVLRFLARAHATRDAALCLNPPSKAQGARPLQKEAERTEESDGIVGFCSSSQNLRRPERSGTAISVFGS